MTTALLIREPWQDGNTETLGWLRVKGETFCMLENPWLNNQASISCIPANEYLVTFLPRSASGRYKNVYHIQNVQGRGGILIHAGNTAKDTRGCPLIGLKHGVLGSQRATLQSRSALRKLVRIMNKESFKLVVTYV